MVLPEAVAECANEELGGRRGCGTYGFEPIARWSLGCNARRPLRPAVPVYGVAVGASLTDVPSALGDVRGQRLSRRGSDFVKRDDALIRQPEDEGSRGVRSVQVGAVQDRSVTSAGWSPKRSEGGRLHTCQLGVACKVYSAAATGQRRQSQECRQDRSAASAGWHGAKNNSATLPLKTAIGGQTSSAQAPHLPR